MTRSLVLFAAVTAAAQLATPPAAGAQQFWKKIKDQAEKKLEARIAKADSTATARAAQTVDSTLAKTGRGVDTLVNRTAALADAAVDKTQDVVSSAAGALAGEDANHEKLVADLAAGRAVLAEIRFEGASDQLTRDSDPHVEHLAKLLRTQTGRFVIEGHVDDTGNAAGDHTLSEKRAAALKSRLVAAGVPPERLFAMGLGAARPPVDPRSSRARIEVARVQ